MKFEKNVAGWNKEFLTITGMVGDHIIHLTTLSFLLSRKQVGKDTWALARSISWKVYANAKGVVGRVGSDSPIAKMHHNGTPPHIIVPRTKSTLRYSQNGKIVYSKLVHHPGTKPNRFLTDSLAKVIKQQTK